jgi:uncharacterized protein YegL
MYTAEISRKNPALILFLLDQSGSMNDSFGGNKALTKKDGATDVINRVLQELVQACTKEGEVRHYFDIGVIGYGFAVGFAGPILGGKLSGRELEPLPELASNPLGIKKVMKKVYDGAGGIIEVPVEMPYWFEPVANADTPMCKALKIAKEIVEKWIRNHPSAFPPIVINITDGEATDGDPELVAEELKRLSTNDGNVLLFNCHISSTLAEPVKWPTEEVHLIDDFAIKLFKMSSVLPDSAVKEAQGAGLPVKPGSRGFVFNADATELVQFLDIGTRVATKKMR